MVHLVWFFFFVIFFCYHVPLREPYFFSFQVSVRVSPVLDFKFNFNFYAIKQWQTGTLYCSSSGSIVSLLTFHLVYTSCGYTVFHCLAFVQLIRILCLNFKICFSVCFSPAFVFALVFLFYFFFVFLSLEIPQILLIAR